MLLSENLHNQYYCVELNELFIVMSRNSASLMGCKKTCVFEFEWEEAEKSFNCSKDELNSNGKKIKKKNKVQ